MIDVDTGQPAVQAAFKELLDHEGEGTSCRWFIKPELHVHCRQILGPMPSEWKDWWVNADGSTRKGKPAVWPPKREGIDEPATSPAPVKHFDELPELHTLPEDKLADRLDMARSRYNAYSPNSEVGCQASQEIDQLYAEYQRRGLTVPVCATSVT